MAKVHTMELEGTNDAWSSGLLSTPQDTPVKTEEDATITRVSVSPMVKGCLPLCLQDCARERHIV